MLFQAEDVAEPVPPSVSCSHHDVQSRFAGLVGAFENIYLAKSIICAAGKDCRRCNCNHELLFKLVCCEKGYLYTVFGIFGEDHLHCFLKNKDSVGGSIHMSLCPKG